MWEQLWLAEALADLPDVSWVNLRGDLGYRANTELTSFWDGEQDPLRPGRPGAFASDDVSVIESTRDSQLVSRTERPGCHRGA